MTLCCSASIYTLLRLLCFNISTTINTSGSYALHTILSREVVFFVGEGRPSVDRASPHQTIFIKYEIDPKSCCLWEDPFKLCLLLFGHCLALKGGGVSTLAWMVWGNFFWGRICLILGVSTGAHNLCYDNRQSIVLAINCNRSVSKNNCN